MKRMVMVLAAMLAGMSIAETVVDISGAGAQKLSVAVKVDNPAFASCLRRNLEMSGLFNVQATGDITVSGTPTASVQALGAGKSVTQPAVGGGDEKAVRMTARRLADAMCEAYGNQKGFACDRIAFVNRKGSNDGEICVSYVDGYDARRLPSVNAGMVGPRWKDANTLYCTALKAGPQVYEYDAVSEKAPTLKWSFKGLTTGAAVSPDGKRVAIILSFQGNPELYVIDGNGYTRLTNTKNASEGCPSWSPDGREIVYMSNETRSQQLYIIDVATKKTRRLTSKGRQNMEPDWGADGRIAYISGGQVKVIAPNEGESSAQVVTTSGGWRHPSWSRDGRHLVASNGKTLFVVDTRKDGEEPKALPLASGNWGDPCWSR